MSDDLPWQFKFCNELEILQFAAIISDIWYLKRLLNLDRSINRSVLCTMLNDPTLTFRISRVENAEIKKNTN